MNLGSTIIYTRVFNILTSSEVYWLCYFLLVTGMYNIDIFMSVIDFFALKSP